MTDPETDLIARYLAGDAEPEEIRELNELLARSPVVVKKLLAEASLDVHLRETLQDSPKSGLFDQLQPAAPAPKTLHLTHWMTAAAFLIAVSGWAMAAYMAGELERARSNTDRLQNRVAELQRSAAQGPVTVAPVTRAKSGIPEINRVRGWLMRMPSQGDKEKKVKLLLEGAAAPAERSLLTCPWGATEFRYASGVSVSAERNTAIRFNESDGQQQLTLEKGIVHVTNVAETDENPTEIICKFATVRIGSGQVAIQVSDTGAVVEAAVNAAEVETQIDGETQTFTVKRGEYMIISPGEKPEIIQGMLKLGLKPPNV